jgi:hypothetical protein
METRARCDIDAIRATIALRAIRYTSPVRRPERTAFAVLSSHA